MAPECFMQDRSLSLSAKSMVLPGRKFKILLQKEYVILAFRILFMTLGSLCAGDGARNKVCSGRSIDSSEVLKFLSSL